MTKTQMLIKILLAMFYCLMVSSLTSLIYIAMTSALRESISNVVLVLMAIMFLLPVNALVGFLVSKDLAMHIDGRYLSIVLVPLATFFVGLPLEALAPQLVYVVVLLVCVFGAHKGRQEMLHKQT